ncbi:helix-turn-helix transcriptional regulator [Sphingomonas sp. HMP6]|uniref:helix-turn-helix transcriptional regulator n=1 Tax=Sphingomonas sp. HMP6 TaxID=1517551 RepID=UPI001596427F|nr:helix-turn-helix transcriptional regulator [Sphingomonas sp. HMP6]
MLLENPEVSIAATVLSADALATVPPPRSVVVPGRVTVTRYVRSGGARMRLWEAEAMRAGFSAGNGRAPNHQMNIPDQRHRVGDELAYRYHAATILWRMEKGRIAALTKQQLACLRKVAELKKSEVIAFELGISPKTVDAHIAEACRRLGASSRREAARMILAETEGFSPKVILPIAVEASDPHFEMSVGDGTNSVRDNHREPTYEFQPPSPTNIAITGGAEDVQLLVALKTAMLIVAIATGIILALA